MSVRLGPKDESLEVSCHQSPQSDSKASVNALRIAPRIRVRVRSVRTQVHYDLDNRQDASKQAYCATDPKRPDWRFLCLLSHGFTENLLLSRQEKAAELLGYQKEDDSAY